jgi:hypothetical protein
MAGAGFNSFTTGSVLTASQVNTFLMDQAVMSFPTAADRTTDLASPSQGMVSFLQDSGTMWVYLEAYNASTNPGGAANAGHYPLPSQAAFIGTFSGNAGTGANVYEGQSSFLFTEAYDALGWHSAVTDTNRVTPNVAGYYRITAGLQYGANASGNRIVVLEKNGTAFARNQIAGTNSGNVQISTIASANGSSDYFRVLTNQDSGSTLSIAGQVSVEFIRATSV